MSISAGRVIVLQIARVCVDLVNEGSRDPHRFLEFQDENHVAGEDDGIGSAAAFEGQFVFEDQPPAGRTIYRVECSSEPFDLVLPCALLLGGRRITVVIPVLLA